MGRGAAAVLAAGLLLFLAPWTVLGSSGDREPVYQGCVEHCQLTACAPYITHGHSCHPAPACWPQASVPWSLWITRWTCRDDCRYQCMLEVERYQRLHGYPAQKYLGKWPFQRILGIQEVASVLFSLLNLLAHTLGLVRLWREHHRTLMMMVPANQQRNSGGGSTGSKGRGRGSGGYPFMWLWTLYSCCHMFAWATSAVFHTRDTRTTELWDYCSAITTIYMGAAAVVVRVFALESVAGVSAALAGAAAGLSWHLHHMLAIKFDYGWNVQVCASIGVASALVWLAWLIMTRHPGRLTLLTFLVLAHAALLLELLDFAPKFVTLMPDRKYLSEVEAMIGLRPQEVLSGLGLLDAHATWHLATVPLTFIFFRFLTLDMKHWVNGGQRDKAHQE